MVPYIFGGIFVTSFFILYGALLYLNHTKIDSIKEFYKKRWLSLFPTYYLAYILIYIESIVTSEVPFDLHHPIRYYIYTLLGMDGYLMGKTWPNNYYILEEWFLGAIIIVYILYPIIVKLLNKKEKLTTLIIVVLYLLTLNYKMLNQDSFRNIFSFIFSFYIGMLLTKNKEIYDVKEIYITSIILLILSSILPISVDTNIKNHLDGFLLYLTLYGIGNKMMKYNSVKAPINIISKVSYEIFLLQHVIVYTMLKLANPASTIRSLSILFFTIIRIISE